ncbi:MAG: VWA domain-containing protein [Micromonosporaceae bacterium]|nr:VWA domain-containing protein [Micromonosporaceae bacterium]
MTGTSFRDQPEVLAGVGRFVGVVRDAGVPAGPDRVHELVRALAELGPGGLYWAGRFTLCASPEDLARYDAVWRSLTGALDRDRRPAPRVPVLRRVAGPDGADGGPDPDGDRDGVEQVVPARASAEEVLRHRDLAELTGPERAEVRRLLALLAPAAPVRVARRLRRAPAGRVDPARTLRAMLRGLGEPARLARRRRRHRPRRLVLLLDISGSMAPYADALLRFGFAAVRARPDRTEVFTIGTRLTRLTPALRVRDPEAALRAAGAQVPDWRGGTRLGAALTDYLRRYGHRGMARRAVVVVCSDGWERGDPARLGAAMGWLSRLAHLVVWVTPHAARPGFAPTAAGLAAALPHVDRLVAGHSLAALAALTDLIRRS